MGPNFAFLAASPLRGTTLPELAGWRARRPLDAPGRITHALAQRKAPPKFACGEHGSGLPLDIERATGYPRQPAPRTATVRPQCKAGHAPLARHIKAGMARHRFRRQQLSLVSKLVWNKAEDSRCLACRKNAKHS